VTTSPVDQFAVAPDPGVARTVDELIERLRSLKVWAGDPSYEAITDRINAAWAAAGRPPGELARRGTVVDCFKLGRRRLNTDLVAAVVRALNPDEGYVAQWRQALRVALGEISAAVQVRAQDRLPDDVAEFTGRSRELDRLRDALRRRAEAGGAVVISAIEGMAGVGKTQLAVHAGHVLAAERRFDQVLFVNLRGFHPDPTQPPADPAAVLDSFLRLLGVPGQAIPHDLPARTTLYRRRLTGTRALVILDNAADDDQVRPLLPESPHCLALVTSRRSLTGLPAATRVPVDVFTPDEAVEFLNRAVPDVRVGDNRDALIRVARRCGHLPLALSLVAAQMRGRPGWTVTDHADRLDERHRQRRLDAGIELALTLSYQQLPDDRRRLVRLLALHPGPHFDPFAAAALAGIDADAAASHLRRLHADHLLQQPAPDRYTFHDLVRTYAADRTLDEDRAPDRAAALTGLFDHYLYTAATAMDTLYPAERHRRPRVPRPAVPGPAVADPGAARAWLDTERTNLVAAAVHAATHGWPDHTTRLAATLFRYLDTGGHYAEVVAVHTHARQAAQHSGDRHAEAQALTDLGNVHGRLGRFEQAADHYRHALVLFRRLADRSGQARALANLGTVHSELGRYRQAADRQQRALGLFREVGDRVGEARALTNLGLVHWRMGRHRQAIERQQRALGLFREVGDRVGEARALTNLGLVHWRAGRHRQAAEHHRQALSLYREVGHRNGEANALNNLGLAYERLGDHEQATEHHQRALVLFREIDDRSGEADALNGLGETLLGAGRHDQARGHHAAALSIAGQSGDRHEQARAHHGLARAHLVTGDRDRARHHWQEALAGYADLGVPEAEQVRAQLAALDDTPDAEARRGTRRPASGAAHIRGD